MRFMIQVRATVSSERGDPPGPELVPLFEEMGAFHEEMARAGVLLDGAGLRPSRQGWRLRYHLDGRREVIEGPFAGPKELIAGYTLIQVSSVEEARAWASRFPNPFPGQPCEIVVRQLYEDADFAPGGDMAMSHAGPKVMMEPQAGIAPASQANDRTLFTERQLAAPPQSIWQAFADPAQLARWWGPDGFANEFEHFDFRPGGGWRFWMIGPDGKRYWNENRFDTLAAPHRIELSHVVDPHFTLTVTLEPEAGGTRLAWWQCFETSELRRALQAICMPANEQNLNRLQAVLADAG